jgi:hypothetical protein
VSIKKQAAGQLLELIDELDSDNVSAFFFVAIRTSDGGVQTNVFTSATLNSSKDDLRREVMKVLDRTLGRRQ